MPRTPPRLHIACAAAALLALPAVSRAQNAGTNGTGGAGGNATNANTNTGTTTSGTTTTTSTVVPGGARSPAPGAPGNPQPGPSVPQPVATGPTSTPPPNTPAPSQPAQTATNTPASVPTPQGAQPVPPVSTPPPPTPAMPQPEGFSFGSYGRVGIGTDLRGHTGHQANIIAHGTRVDEGTYAELEVHRDDNFGDVHTRMVATLAIQGPLFHENGNFDISMAVRNLYLEERGVFDPNLALWVGSRMYRGDDIYLLNWWPLDNLNTVGGGARYDLGNYATAALQVGTNRLDNSYQYQTVNVAPREGIGAVRVVLLDRPRFISSLKLTAWLMGRSARTGVKASLYGEVHQLPSGERQNTDTGEREQLPSDSGFVLGGQVGAYAADHNAFVNLFFRYAQGLAAYGDLGVPYTLNNALTSGRARDVVLAVAGNYEIGFAGVMFAAYLRYFRDADPAIYGRNDLFEGTVVVRPNVWFGQHAGLAVEGSYQAIVYNMLDPVTGQGPRGAAEWRFAVMPFVTPAGRGAFTRPHLRLVYALSVRDQGALRLYAPDDPLGRYPVEHYLGLNCEWWFNSSYL